MWDISSDIFDLGPTFLYKTDFKTPYIHCLALVQGTFKPVE